MQIIKSFQMRQKNNINYHNVLLYPEEKSRNATLNFCILRRITHKNKIHRFVEFILNNRDNNGLF